LTINAKYDIFASVLYIFFYGVPYNLDNDSRFETPRAKIRIKFIALGTSMEENMQTRKKEVIKISKPVYRSTTLTLSV